MIILVRVVEEMGMKKKLFLCIAVSLVVFETTAKDVRSDDVRSERPIVDIRDDVRGGIRNKKSSANMKKNKIISLTFLLRVTVAHFLKC